MSNFIFADSYYEAVERLNYMLRASFASFFLARYLNASRRIYIFRPKKKKTPLGRSSPAAESEVTALHLFTGPVNKKKLAAARRVHKTLKPLEIDCVSLHRRETTSLGDFFTFAKIPFYVDSAGSLTRENSVVIGGPARDT